MFASRFIFVLSKFLTNYQYAIFLSSSYFMSYRPTIGRSELSIPISCSIQRVDEVVIIQTVTATCMTNLLRLSSTQRRLTAIISRMIPQFIALHGIPWGPMEPLPKNAWIPSSKMGCLVWYTASHHLTMVADKETPPSHCGTGFLTSLFPDYLLPAKVLKMTSNQHFWTKIPSLGKGMWSTLVLLISQQVAVDSVLLRQTIKCKNGHFNLFQFCRLGRHLIRKKA